MRIENSLIEAIHLLGSSFHLAFEFTTGRGIFRVELKDFRFPSEPILVDYLLSTCFKSMNSFYQPAPSSVRIKSQHVIRPMTLTCQWNLKSTSYYWCSCLKEEAAQAWCPSRSCPPTTQQSGAFQETVGRSSPEQ